MSESAIKYEHLKHLKERNDKLERLVEDFARHYRETYGLDGAYDTLMLRARELGIKT